MSRPNKHRNQNMKPRRERRGFSNKQQDRASSIKQFLSRYKMVIRSCTVFFILIGGFTFLYSRLIISRSFDTYLGFNARVTGILLNLTGSGVSVKDTVVSSPQFAFQIVDLCTAIMPMMIFTAAIIAFPSTFKQKLLGLLLGLAGIFLINQIRLVSLFYIGTYIPSILEMMHMLVWQALMILLTIGIWLGWAYRHVRTTAL